MAANLVELTAVGLSHAAIMHSNKHLDARAQPWLGFEAEAAASELGPFAHCE
jgi:hypothetical protein